MTGLRQLHTQQHAACLVLLFRAEICRALEYIMNAILSGTRSMQRVMSALDYRFPATIDLWQRSLTVVRTYLTDRQKFDGSEAVETFDSIVYT
jgi:hypothetical protein